MSKFDQIEVDIKQKAIRFRIDNGFSNTEPIRLKSLLLKCNVLTIFRPLSDNFSGMAIKINDDRFMLVNCEHNLGKQHFTIAHELYHLFIQENFTAKQCVTGKFDKNDIEEYKADLFSSYFLLPEDGLVINIPSPDQGKDKIKLESILKLEQYYSISRRALLQRLKNIGLITSAIYDRYAVDVRKSANAFGYGTDLYANGNTNVIIGDYGVRANHLFNEERISESHYLELMRTIGFDPLENGILDNE